MAAQCSACGRTLNTRCVTVGLGGWAGSSYFVLCVVVFSTFRHWRRPGCASVQLAWDTAEGAPIELVQATSSAPPTAEACRLFVCVSLPEPCFCSGCLSGISCRQCMLSCRVKHVWGEAWSLFSVIRWWWTHLGRSRDCASNLWGGGWHGHCVLTVVPPPGGR